MEIFQLELETLSTVQHLIYHTNQLTGTIPTSITSLNSIVLLDLSNNELTGTIPTTIGINIECHYSIEFEQQSN